jgi:hypothetical protein
MTLSQDKLASKSQIPATSTLFDVEPQRFCWNLGLRASCEKFGSFPIGGVL